VNLTAVKKIKPLDSPLRNRILDAAKNKSVHKENNKMEESEMKKLLDEMQKIATKTVEATFENQFKEKEIKKNAADIEQAQKILELARETLGEEAADKEADEIFAELVKVLKAAEESGAESEANKFVGAGLRKNKDGKDTPIFLEAKARFLALGPKVFVRRNCEKLHEELRGNETFKLLRQSELNPASVATSEFQSGESY
jgi:hypothetical protein